MKKRILGLALALIMIISLLPMSTFAATTKLAITLWGTEVTIDNDDATTDIKDALYWKNDASGIPVEATATDWNISYTIVDGVPTLTLKNAVYTGASAFLYKKPTAAYNLNVVYEGTNTLTRTGGAVVDLATPTSHQLFKVNFIGKEGAVLNLEGGASSAPAVNISNKANTASLSEIKFIGGTVNVKRKTSGNYSVIKISEAKAFIEDCTMTITSTNSGSSVFGAGLEIGETYGGESASYPRKGAAGLTIKNSNVTINTDTPMGIAAHNVHWAAKNGCAQKVLIEGTSNVSVTVNSKASGGNQECGISAYTLALKDTVALEVKVSNSAVENETALVLADTSATGPDLTGYVGQYNMYTTEGAEPVTAYTATTYLKIGFKPCTTHAGVVTDCTKDTMCTNPGCQEVYAAKRNAHEANADDGDCTTAVTCKHCTTVMTPAKTEHKDTRTDCSVAGTCANPGCTYAFTAGQHNPAADDGDCTTDILCASCGKVAVKGQTAHKYTDKNDTTCDNAGCTNTRKVDGTENPKTGDNTALVLALSLMMVASAAFVCTKKFVR